MKKNIFLVILLALLLFLLGCANTNNQGNTEETKNDNTATNDYEAALRSANKSQYTVGDVFYLGEYNALHADWDHPERDSNKASQYSHRMEKLDWRILEINGSCATVISAHILDQKAFGEISNSGNIEDEEKCVQSLNWENSSIRKWLNEEVYKNAFNDSEKSAILSTKVSNARISEYDSFAGPDTVDKLYFLSVDEIYRYFPNMSDRQKIALIWGDVQMYLGRGFWLRTIHNSDNDIKNCGYVSNTGEVCLNWSPYIGVESVLPVMSVDLNVLDAID